MIDQYSKISTTIQARIENVENPVIIITSSHPEVNCLSYGTGVCDAFNKQNKKTLLIDARLEDKVCAEKSEIKSEDNIKTLKLIPSDDKNNYINNKKIKDLLNTYKNDFDAIVIVTDCINNSQPAMIFVAESNGVVLCEKKKISRTDYIDNAIVTIKNLNAQALGFILE